MFLKLLTRQFERLPASIRLNSSEAISELEVNLNKYRQASDSTLEELSDKLDSILENRFDSGADVSLNNGVLTAVIDENNTYVINKQTPNRQIWLSSPVSGPKRFDLVSDRWIEKHTNTEMRKLLSEELSKLLKERIEL